MKDSLVRGVRRYLPTRLTEIVEEIYRRGRVWLISARYGFPAKGMRVISITGTHGKTTTAAYLNEILKSGGTTNAMFGPATIEIAG